MSIKSSICTLAYNPSSSTTAHEPCRATHTQTPYTNATVDLLWGHLCDPVGVIQGDFKPDKSGLGRPGPQFDTRRGHLRTCRHRLIRFCITCIISLDSFLEPNLISECARLQIARPPSLHTRSYPTRCLREIEGAGTDQQGVPCPPAPGTAAGIVSAMF